ncbi:MAG: hypothetical protein AB7D92_01245 [Sphaerochaeta sp.]
MQALIKLILLGLTFFLVFINPTYIGTWLYYSLFPVLFLLVWVFYRITYYVSEKEVVKRAGMVPRYSLFCAMVPPLGDGDLTRGRLVVSENDLILFRREGHRSIKEAYRLPIQEIEGFTIGKVLSVRSGITFKAKDMESKFVVSRAHAKKEALTAALGWSRPPEEVEVGQEAGNAPSFKDL